MENKVADGEKKPLLLLVDDVSENLQLLAQHLAGDYELALATDGAQAAVLANEIEPDLILLDIMMPGIDGYETCRRIKSNLKTRTIPVIFLTARGEVEDMVKAFELGGVDYVTKPFRPAELKARVKTHIQLRRLKSLLSMCAQCNKIRNEKGEWERVDSYITHHTETRISHGYCPDCYEKIVQSL